MVAGGAMVFACCALLALALSSSGDSKSERFHPTAFAQKAISAGVPVHHSMLDDAPAATDASNSTSADGAPTEGATAAPSALKFSWEKIKVNK